MEIAKTHPSIANLCRWSVLLEGEKPSLPLFHSQIQPEVDIPKFFKGQIVSTLRFELRNKMATNIWGSSPKKSLHA